MMGHSVENLAIRHYYRDVSCFNGYSIDQECQHIPLLFYHSIRSRLLKKHSECIAASLKMHDGTLSRKFSHSPLLSRRVMFQRLLNRPGMPAYTTIILSFNTIKAT